MYFISISGLDYSELPLIASEIFTSDFFSNEERVETYADLYNAAQYVELYEFVTTFIEENDPNDHDSAFTILEILRPVLEVMDRVEVVQDDFTGESTIYRQGVTEINGQTNIVPSLAVGSTSTNIEVGFRNNGWIFFDSVSFRASSGDIFTKRQSNTNTEILYDGTIEERVNVSFSDEELEMLVNSNEITLRFEGDRTLDIELSENEIDAIRVYSILTDVYKSLSNLYSHFQR